RGTAGNGASSKIISTRPGRVVVLPHVRVQRMPPIIWSANARWLARILHRSWNLAAKPKCPNELGIPLNCLQRRMDFKELAMPRDNHEITRDDILSLSDYETIRAEKRQENILRKKFRRMAIGPYATIHFESWESMWLQ